MQPFKCPHCGSTDYVVVLTGCEVSGATIEEGFSWNPDSGLYDTTGSVMVEAEELENEGGHALCSKCERDVSQELAAYEQSQDTGNA